MRHDARACADRVLAGSPEILDFGYPQNSESDTLKMYITTEGVKSEQAVVRRESEPATLSARGNFVLTVANALNDRTARGGFKDHDSGDWSNLVAKKRRQVPEERGVRRRDRDCQPLDELERSVAHRGRT